MGGAPWASVISLISSAFLPSSEPQWTARASEVWSYVLVPLTLTLVPMIDLAWMCHLPNWCCFNPPPRIDSISEGLDQLDTADHAGGEVRTASGNQKCDHGLAHYP